MSRLTLSLVVVFLFSMLLSAFPRSVIAQEGEASPPSVESVDYATIDRGDRTLLAACFGSGGPTVIQEIGGPDPAGGVVLIEEVGAIVSGWLGAKFCGYDRAGTGQSPAGSTGVRTLDDAGTDLLAVLAAPELDCPCVIMAESLGGGITLAAITQDSSQFAGLVLLDSLTPGFADEVLRLAPEGSPESALSDFFAGDNEEHIDYHMTDEMVPAVAPTIPVRVLTHGAGYPPPCPCSEGFPVDELEASWQQNQQGLADSFGVELIVAENTGHAITSENTELVVETIIEVIGEIGKQGTPVESTPEA